MDANKDYYAILGVLPSAEEVVIRAAYKALAHRYHPDRFGGQQEEANGRMVEINEAYSILSDPTQRKEYDKLRGSNTQATRVRRRVSISEAHCTIFEQHTAQCASLIDTLHGLQNRGVMQNRGVKSCINTPPLLKCRLQERSIRSISVIGSAGDSSKP